MKYLVLYFVLISAVSLIVTVYDKIASKKYPRNRVPEKYLFLLSAIGGSVSMYITMQIIRHKTRHKRFMIGIPVIFILQISVLIFVMFAN